jgi:hypothetical protein
MADIFVSYASSDRERVAGLVRRLEQLGFSVWWDRDIAHGQNYHRVIEQALDEAKCAIVVWSAQSVNSEWVVNEASSARKRNALVPVLLEAVEAPLEFRHLQTADLREENPNAEREYDKLKRSVRQIVGGASTRAAAAGAPGQTEVSVKAKSFWHTPIAWAIGAGVLLLGLAALLAVLSQIGWLGQAQTRAAVSVPPSAAPAEVQPAPPAGTQTQAGAVNAAAEAEPTAAANEVAAAQPAANERVNLLDPEHGAQIVAAGEEGWRRILEAKQPACSIISGQTFAVVGLRNEQPTQIDTLAVHVDAQSSYNLKTVALFAADAERGPFKKIGEFEIPNYKNMRAPFHEFKFEATTARFVKLQIANFVHGDGPNGNVCTMRLLGAN